MLDVTLPVPMIVGAPKYRAEPVDNIVCGIGRSDTSKGVSMGFYTRGPEMKKCTCLIKINQETIKLF